MKKDVYISVIIPTYNRAPLIKNTLSSIQNQSATNFEVIIVDDGSTDQTEYVVQEFLNERIKYYKIENGERGKARNFGTKKAIGNYINWFDSDDIMLPNHIQILSEKIVENNFPNIITTHYSILNAQTQQTSYPPFLIGSNKKFKDALIKGNCLSCNGVVVKKSIAIDEPFNEIRALSASEDYELWLRLASKFQFINLDIVTTTIIQHEDRSVNLMTNSKKLEERFNTFIELTTNDEKVKFFLIPDFNFFIMRNYLLLAVDLAFNKHRRKSFFYLKKALNHSKKALNQRLFWATIKHLIFK